MREHFVREKENELGQRQSVIVDEYGVERVFTEVGGKNDPLFEAGWDYIDEKPKVLEEPPTLPKIVKPERIPVHNGQKL